MLPIPLILRLRGEAPGGFCPYTCRPFAVAVLGLLLFGHQANCQEAKKPEKPPAADLKTVSTENRRCLDCHGQEHIAELPPGERFTMVKPVPGQPPPTEQELAEEPETRPELLLDYDRVFAFSSHRQVTCASCHPDCRELPHPYRTKPAQCGECHSAVQTEYEESVHGEAIAAGSKVAAHCSDCHGAHDILSHLNPQSRTYKLHLPTTCGECHTNKEIMEQAKVGKPRAVEKYLDSMHGRGLISSGLVVAPTCNDCHGTHEIRTASDPASKIHHDNVPDTCGACHKGVEDIYMQSVHGKLLANGDEKGPGCVDCHLAHEIVKPSEASFKLQSDKRCGECHEERLVRYRETFHGKAMALGVPGVAACYDCHGHHDILPVDDPRSHLSEERRLETCRKCHPDARGDFGGYIAHGDHSNAEDYPLLYWTFFVMTSIVLGTFIFFGFNTSLWLTRSLILYFRDPVAFREIKTKIKKDDEEFVRFKPFERFLHGLVVTSFLLLVATGMPLKFYDSPWALTLVSCMGGLEMAAGLHRFGAYITGLYFFLHLSSLVKSLYRRRRELLDPETGRYSLKRHLKIAFGPEMPVPNLDDLRDFWAHQKWAYGKGPHPKFDKWTYWEKFDYFAVFWGVLVIGMSGLVMWFPEFFTSFLPGWIVNVALIVHSDEALLAAGFIFTFHFFNVHFRMEKFPMDPVMFSGRISRSELEHERQRWYERLCAEEGGLEKIRVRDDWWQWRRVMHPIGFLAFGLGTFFLILILIAMGLRLFSFSQ